MLLKLLMSCFLRILSDVAFRHIPPAIFAATLVLSFRAYDSIRMNFTTGFLNDLLLTFQSYITLRKY